MESNPALYCPGLTYRINNWQFLQKLAARLRRYLSALPMDAKATKHTARTGITGRVAQSTCADKRTRQDSRVPAILHMRIVKYSSWSMRYEQGSV
jgi:hypothetical protein